MKNAIKVISVAMCLFFAVTAFACKKPEEGEKGAYLMVKDGQTEYTVVVPETASETVSFAAQELQYFFKEVTDIEISVKKDSDISSADAGKYISLGKTKLLADAEISVDETTLGMDGYLVKQKSDDIYLCGGADDGTVYAVYGLLKELFNLEIYTADCYTFDQKSEVRFDAFDFTDVPDIPFRVLGRSNTWYSTKENMFRMRVTNAEKRMSNLGHALYYFIPAAVYFDDHPEWFSVKNKPSGHNDWQLCMTNEEMKAEFIENVKTFVEENPSIDIVSLGQNDGYGYCTCDNCAAKEEEYGAVSGAYVAFCNDVAAAVTEWMRGIDAARASRLQFYMFAYTFTEKAPVKDGKPTIRCADNVGVLVAPIGAHVSHAYSDMATNASSAGIFKNWKTVSDNFYIWSYSTHFANYYMPHNSFGSIQKNIQDYVDIGAQFVFDQATCGNSVSNFDALKTYLFSKLLWDSELHFDTLVQNFMNAYYGEAAGPHIYRFFDVMRSYLTSLEYSSSQYAECASQRPTNVSSQYFPQNYLYYLDDIFYDAFEALDNAKSADEEAYALYKGRVDFEYLDVLYLQLELYRGAMSNSEKKELIERFQDIAIENRMNNFNESGTITLSSLINTWKQ